MALLLSPESDASAGFRMFAPPPPSPGKMHLSALEARMFGRDDAEGNDLFPPPGRETSAIHTYIGQMVAHDIVSPTTLHTFAVSPYLDFASLYGHPGEQRAGQWFEGRGEFRLGKLDANSGDGTDLRRVDGVAQIADPRNDENHLVSQMHLFWQRFHNCVVRDTGMEYHGNVSDFPREITTRAFQFVVLTDYLATVLNEDVYQYYRGNGPRVTAGGYTKVPDEFSMAVFRKGHTMVRQAYTLSDSSGQVPMEQLFRGHRSKPFASSDVIDWHRVARQEAGRIDMALAPAMSKPPFPTRKSIVAINLEAGSALPSGVSVCRTLMQQYPALAQAVGLAPLVSADLERGRIRGLGLTLGALPLWLYTLQEARVDGVYHGDRLGRLGSVIAGDVVFSSVVHAPQNIASLLERSFDEWCSELGPFGEFLRNRPDHVRDRIGFLDVVDYVQSHD